MGRTPKPKTAHLPSSDFINVGVSANLIICHYFLYRESLTDSFYRCVGFEHLGKLVVYLNIARFIIGIIVPDFTRQIMETHNSRLCNLLDQNKMSYVTKNIKKISKVYAWVCYMMNLNIFLERKKKRSNESK